MFKKLFIILLSIFIFNNSGLFVLANDHIKTIERNLQELKAMGLGKDGDIVNVGTEGITLEDLGIDPKAIGSNGVECSKLKPKAKACNVLFEALPRLKKTSCSK